MFTRPEPNRALYPLPQPGGAALPTPFQFAPLVKPTQKVLTVESEDRRYDFLFPNASQMVLKLSEMNALNGKKMGEAGQSYPNFAANLKSLSDKIESSTALLAELQKKSDELGAKLSCSVEQRLRDCLLATKGVYAKARLIGSLLQGLSAECDIFAEALKVFHESFLRIKSDTKMYYEHPSRPLLDVIAAIRNRVEIVRFAMADLVCVMEAQADCREEEGDNLRHYVSIVEDLNCYFQIVVKRANDLAAAIKSAKARIFGANNDRLMQVAPPPPAPQLAAQQQVKNRINDLMRILDSPRPL